MKKSTTTKKTKAAEKPKRKYVRKPVEPVVEPIPVYTPLRSTMVNEAAITGVGDVIKKVTNFLGFETCDACEERRIKLNKMFPFFKQAKELSDDEIVFLKRIHNETYIGTEDRNYLFGLYNKTFGFKIEKCLCPSLQIEIREKLWNLYLANHSKNIEE